MDNIDAVIARLEKLEFYIKLLSEELNPNESPIASLVIGHDWTEADLDKAHDIFEKYDKLLVDENKINWHAFEKEFKDQLGISYQGLKSIVLAFYRNGQWESVCQSYASSFGNTVPLELKKIASSTSR